MVTHSQRERARASHDHQERRQGETPALPRRLGDRLCLDFANTVEPRIGPETPADALGNYADLVRWGQHAGVLTAPQGRDLLATAAAQPAAAMAAFRRALALREAIDRVFRALAQGRAPATADLAVVHETYVVALTHAQLVATADGFSEAWRDEEGALDRMLWPVARSAVTLLVDGDLARVKECPGPANDCGWLFYDTSKNASRRWCSMEGCGSVAKMRHYRARRHAATP